MYLIHYPTWIPASQIVVMTAASLPFQVCWRIKNRWDQNFCGRCQSFELPTVLWVRRRASNAIQPVENQIKSIPKVGFGDLSQPAVTWKETSCTTIEYSGSSTFLDFLLTIRQHLHHVQQTADLLQDQTSHNTTETKTVQLQNDDLQNVCSVANKNPSHDWES